MIFYRADAVFDGERLHAGQGLVMEGSRVVAFTDVPPAGAELRALGPGIVAPGLVDLQVNGGGGVMLGDADAEDLRRIALAHRALGTTAFLPTLITDTPDRTRAVIELVAATSARGVAGLHLEGPHLDPRRKGAHDAALIRPMTEADLDLYLEAAARLSCLKITLAPEAATPAQITALAEAGVHVALGHTNCTAAAATTAETAGARLVTHLFNAMSQMQGRAPGLVGAALASDRLRAGIIADGLHVDPVSLIAALRALGRRAYLVTDAMAVAGTDLDRFTLGGREILRREGRLTLADGTLAGADLTLPRAMTLIAKLGLPMEEALALATSRPAEALGLAPRHGTLTPGEKADPIWIAPDLSRATPLD